MVVEVSDSEFKIPGGMSLMTAPAAVVEPSQASSGFLESHNYKDTKQVNFYNILRMALP